MIKCIDEVGFVVILMLWNWGISSSQHELAILHYIAFSSVF